MNAPAPRPLGINTVLLVGAVILFVLAALFFFGLGNVKTSTDEGLVAVGLAALAASFLPI